jgi:hypothetical protein
VRELSASREDVLALLAQGFTVHHESG